MYPIDLTVPKAEQELAIRLGARRNEKYEGWYVPRTLNVEPLSRWFTAREYPTQRSNKAWLARAIGACPYCAENVALYSLILPAGHRGLCPGEEESEDAWDFVEVPSQLYEIGYLSASLQAVLRVHARTYRVGYSALLERFCWMNHCSHCQELIEDDTCALEFGSPLDPLNESMAEAILLKEFRVEFEVSCGSFSCDVQFIDAMTRVQA